MESFKVIVWNAGKPAEAELTAEVVRAFGYEQKPLLDQLDKLLASHRNDHPE